MRNQRPNNLSSSILAPIDCQPSLVASVVVIPVLPASTDHLGKDIVQRQRDGGKGDSAGDNGGRRPGGPSSQKMAIKRPACETALKRKADDIQAYVTGAGCGLPQIGAWDANELQAAGISDLLTYLAPGHLKLLSYMNLPRTPALLQPRAGANQAPGRLHLVFLNPQGNFDAAYSGLNTHPDFGGQLTYVSELAQAMAERGDLVEVATRRFADVKFPFESFNQTTSPLFEAANGGVASVLRSDGGVKGFVAKEQLWPILETMARQLAVYWTVNGQVPDASIAHYADGGFMAARLSALMDIPFATFTGHSLGAQKLDTFVQSHKDIRVLNMAERIAAECLSMAGAAKIVVSTDSERSQQYAHPLYIDAIQPNGADRSRFHTVAPGVNPRVFGAAGRAGDEQTIAALEAAIRAQLAPERQHLPLVIAAGRLDGKKNHISLAQAFAASPELQAEANLLLLLGNHAEAFKAPTAHFPAASEALNLAQNIRQVLVDGDLEHLVVTPGLANTQQQFAAICRHLGKKKQGILTLVSHFEPFGLMPLEAAYAGTPVVVTKNGGPQNSLQGRAEDGSLIEYGKLVDPADPLDIAQGLRAAIADYDGFQRRGRDRVASSYLWSSTAKEYREIIVAALESARAG